MYIQWHKPEEPLISSQRQSVCNCLTNLRAAQGLTKGILLSNGRCDIINTVEKEGNGVVREKNG